MKFFGVFFGLLIIQFNCFCISKTAAYNIENNYRWNQVNIGAGGWVTGIDMQKEGNVIYCRTDVGGAYRLDKDSDTWIQLVDTSSMPDLENWDSSEYGVQSIVSAPSDKDVVYMVFANGNFYKSNNQGNEWIKTPLHTYVESNGDARCQGERIAVDPINSDIVYYGSHKDGLKRTLDGGYNWETIGQVPVGSDKVFGIGTVVFDPNSSVEDSSTQVLYATVHETGVFQSKNGGQTWNNISEGFVPNGRFEDAEVGSDSSYYVILANKKQVWKYKNETWQNLFTGTHDQLRDITIDPNNGKRIFVTEYSGRSNRTLDGGKNWQRLSLTRETNTDIPWLSKTEVGWFSFGEIIFDTNIAGKLWICEGIGVWTTTDIDDAEITWHSVSKGIEELVSVDIISPPGGRPLASFWDRAVFRIEDPLVYPSKHYPTLNFDSGWDLAYCPTKSSFIVATVADHRSCCENNVTSYSEDRGKTWKEFKNLPYIASHGNMAVSANNVNNIVLLPTDNQLPYYTKDKGETWSQASLPGSSTGGHQWYSSGQDILTSDAVEPSTFYIYHRDKGLYRSTDGGAVWELVNSSIRRKTTKKVKLRSVPGKANHLFLSFGLDKDYSLSRSKDGGISWETFWGTRAVMVSLGKEAEGSDYPTIFFNGTYGGVKGIWRSTDEGKTWDKVGHYPLGITARPNALEGDMNHFGVVYIGFPGNGVAYGYDKSYPPDFSIPEEEISVGTHLNEIQSNHEGQIGLFQIFPNPSKSRTTIQYSIPNQEFVSVKVYDINGKVVAELENKIKQAGNHTVEMDRIGLKDGVYLCKIIAGSFSDSKKISFN